MGRFGLGRFGSWAVLVVSRSKNCIITEYISVIHKSIWQQNKVENVK